MNPQDVINAIEDLQRILQGRGLSVFIKNQDINEHLGICSFSVTIDGRGFTIYFDAALEFPWIVTCWHEVECQSLTLWGAFEGAVQGYNASVLLAQSNKPIGAISLKSTAV